MRFGRDLTGIACLLLLLLLGACQSTAPQVVESPTPTPQAEPSPDPRVAEMQVLLAELLDRIEVLNARLQRVESGNGGSVTQAPSPAPQRPLTSAAIAERYRSALAMFGKGQLDNARRMFQEVLESDPNGELADNALYWIAEAWFVTGKYSDAMKLYRRILNDYSDQNKAPDAMLKMGLAYVKLGDLALARTTFEQLIQQYPYSTPASSAKLEIKRIQY